MQRIALLLPDLEAGGAQRIFVSLAERFVDRGLRVDFVLAQPTGAYLSQLPGGIRLIDLGRNGAFPTRPGLALTALIRLVVYLRRERPEYLLSSLTGTNLLALLARRFAAVPTRLVIREANTLLNIGNRVLLPLMRRFYPAADHIVAISHGVAEHLVHNVGLPNQQIRVIHNPIDVPRVQQLAQQDSVHPWLVAGQPPVVLGVGRLVPQKDFATLIRAFAEMTGKRSVRLIILGEGKARAELQSLARNLKVEEAVSFPGFVENPFTYMARAAVFVFSSAWEGFGNVLVEALACGTPVVSTDCPSGPAEILDGGKYGPLVPVGDAHALAQATLATLVDPPPAEMLRTRAQEFSLDRGVEKYLEVLGVS